MSLFGILFLICYISCIINTDPDAYTKGWRQNQKPRGNPKENSKKKTTDRERVERRKRAKKMKEG
jgi:hypothetical protein